jgi:hypothetical protein
MKKELWLQTPNLLLGSSKIKLEFQGSDYSSCVICYLALCFTTSQYLNGGRVCVCVCVCVCVFDNDMQKTCFGMRDVVLIPHVYYRIDCNVS